MCFLLTRSQLGISALKIRTTSLNIHKLTFFYEALRLLLSIKLVIISKYIYNSQQKFGATSSSVWGSHSSVWLFTLPQVLIQYMPPHQWANRENMYCNTPYVVKQFAWNGPFIVVECALSAYADVQAHSCMHCQDAVGTCVYVLFVCEENAWRSLPASPGRRQGREWRQTHTRTAERGYCTPCHASVKKTVAGCWFCSHSFYILWGGGQKKGFLQFLFFSSPPVSITGRRPKQSNYELNIHLSLAALHNSVGEAGWKDLFVCLT